MKLHQTTLIELLKLHETQPQTAIQGKLSALSIEEISSLYIDTAFTNSGLQFLQEQHWLLYKNQLLSNSNFKEFLTPYFNSELHQIFFLEEFLADYEFSKIKLLINWVHRIEKVLLQYVQDLQLNEQKLFATCAVHSMNNLYKNETDLEIIKKSQKQNLELSLYRTFDGLDRIFELNYLSDQNMNIESKNSERLYSGSGIGVQSSYATLLTALRFLNPSRGSRVIDLGSGFGRLGLVVGLLRPDIDFVGYEYVEHRVEIAKSACRKLEIEKHVQFYTQDLSVQNFEIPLADIYYLYDPFTKETYRHVLSQLVHYSQKHFIRIVTKGNARDWLQEIADKEGWPPVQEHDSGNLCLFQTR